MRTIELKLGFGVNLRVVSSGVSKLFYKMFTSKAVPTFPSRILTSMFEVEAEDAV